MAEAYIVAAARTAGGRRNGKLSGWHPADLAAQVLDALMARTDCDPALVEDVILGCVGQSGEQAVNIARNAVLASRLPEGVPATSVDRQCGSSQQALHFAAQAVMSGTMDVVIAAGVESMTRVPMGSPSILAAKAGQGTYMSPNIQARYPGVQFSQFTGAEMIAKKYGMTKRAARRLRLRVSHQRADPGDQGRRLQQPRSSPVKARMNDGTETGRDAHGGRRHPLRRHAREALRQRQADRRRRHVCTAATASQICDGAARASWWSTSGV